MSSYQHLSVVQLQQMMAEDAELQIVDIRDPASFETAHIPGAVRLGNDNLADYLRDADMDKPWLSAVIMHQQPKRSGIFATSRIR